MPPSSILPAAISSATVSPSPLLQEAPTDDRRRDRRFRSSISALYASVSPTQHTLGSTASMAAGARRDRRWRIAAVAQPLSSSTSPAPPATPGSRPMSTAAPRRDRRWRMELSAPSFSASPSSVSTSPSTSPPTLGQSPTRNRRWRATSQLPSASTPSEYGSSASLFSAPRPLTSSRAGCSASAPGSVPAPVSELAALRSLDASAASPSLGLMVPARVTTASEVWAALGPDNVLTCVMTADAAQAICPKANVPLLLTPARHLVMRAHGSADMRVVRKASELLWSSVKLGTRKEYAGHIIAYLTWCDELGLPTHYRFPAAQNILLMYLRKDVTTLRAGTISQRQFALAYWHRIHRLPWALDKADTRAFEKALAINCLPPLEKRRPVRLNDITVIAAAAAQSEDRAHVAIAAAAIFAFYSMSRPGEVTVRSASDPPTDRACWVHLLDQPSFKAGGPSSVILALPTEKARGTAGLDRIAPQQRHMPALCPVVAVGQHRHVNAPRAGEDATAIGAFSYLGRTGSRNELTESLFARTVNTWLKDAGRDPVTGHYFRIGGATLFFAAGRGMDEIKTRGGWQSDAYLVYLRDNYARQAATFGDLDPTDLFYA
ncbi:hypothetical protein CF335_g7564 [Tilletia laevis]|nr:hypothetical protein CF335_g7564 [Tilletia laevis]